MLIGTLAACLLRNMLAGKEVTRAAEETIVIDGRTIRADQDF